ncbi:MAG TPA: TolC family protein [Candidatus Binatia bacterium]|nr:TolC family protein [Candidatus Binatia bacterium]
MKTIIPVLFICILTWSVAAAAEDAGAELRFSLKAAQDYAVKFSTETRNARIDVAQARKKIWETTASGLPQLNATLSYRDSLKIPTTLIPARFLDPDAAEGEFIGLKFGTQHNATVDVTASQLVFNGSYFVALQASKVYLQLARDQQEKKEIDIRETVASTYHLVLLAEKNRQILGSSLENLRQTWQETEAMNRAGFLEATAVDQLQLAVSDLENTLATTERQIETAYRLLKLQMGVDQARSIVLSDTLASIMAAMDAGLPAPENFELSRHIDLRVMETQERSLAMLLKREKAEYLPTLTAFLSLSQSAMRDRFNFFRPGGDWFPATILGFNLSVPVFTSGLLPARVAQARLELEKAQNLKKQVADGLQLAADQARSDFVAALEREKNTASMAILAQRIFSDTRSKFSQGLATSMELTQAHNQYLSADAGHSQAQVQLLDARVRLDKALNRL